MTRYGKLQVIGGSAIQGEVTVSGAKNAALPILAASLLVDGQVSLRQVPDLHDVTTLMQMLCIIGVQFTLTDQGVLELDTRALNKQFDVSDLASRIRASFLILGPILSRFGYCKLSFPGGCAIGPRPVDLHLDGMRALGATVTVHEAHVVVSAPPEGLQGAEVFMKMPSVTATENIIMAAVLAKGRTIIHSPAQEPEIVDLVGFLNALGADIHGAGTASITINGVKSLKPNVDYTIIGDRIEAGTYLIAAAMTKGHIKVNGISSNDLSAVLDALKQTGATVDAGDQCVSLNMHGKRAKAVSISTAPFPGFPTDLQAQWVALNTVAEGCAVVDEQVFVDRIKHIKYYRKMLANIDIKGSEIHSKGVTQLCATDVYATDLRASAGLLLAALVAQGETIIHDAYHIDRGYAYLEEKFLNLGANLRRVLLVSELNEATHG